MKKSERQRPLFLPARSVFRDALRRTQRMDEYLMRRLTSARVARGAQDGCVLTRHERALRAYHRISFADLSEAADAAFIEDILRELEAA
jgi:hypothetical protein